MTDDLDVPPSDLDAERSVLGAILLEPKWAIDKASAAHLSRKHFYRTAHAAIYEEMECLAIEHGAVDLEMLLRALDARDVVDAEPWRDILRACTASVASPTLVEMYAKRIIEAHVKRAGIYIAKSLDSASRNGIAGVDALQNAARSIARVVEEVGDAEASEENFKPKRSGELLLKPPEDKSRHIWRDVIAPGTITLFAGGPKSGKSTVLDCLFAARERGEEWVDGTVYQPEWTAPFYVSEEGDDSLTRRAKRAQIQKVDFYNYGCWPSTYTWAQLTTEAVRRAYTSGAPVVVFDTIRGLQGFGELSENDASACTNLVAPIRVALSKYPIAVVLVHHRRKSPREGMKVDAIEAVAGNNALTGAVDHVLGVSLHGEEDSNLRILYARGRLDMTEGLVVECHKNSDRWTFTKQGSVSEVRYADLDAKILSLFDRVPLWFTKEQVVSELGGKDTVVKGRVGALSRARKISEKHIDGERYPRFARLGLDPMAGVKE